MQRERYDFASDNTAGICPEAWAALVQANSEEAAASYGEDRWTAEACALVREIFETDCDVFFVFNGTAANALALSQLCRPFESVLCHEQAHIETDECGAPEFFSGGSKLLPTRGAQGKLDLAAVTETIARQPELHSPRPRALSVTQATELGTVYTASEVCAIGEFAHGHSLRLHMDGARFANAVAALACQPREITWQAGVDVLSFGGTKNGTAAGELVVFFDKELAGAFDYRAKQAGQLGSKMRFLGAPWVGLLRDGVWLKNASHANAMAQRLAQKLRELAVAEIAFPCQSSAIFLRFPETLVQKLNNRGWRFYKFIEPDIYRIMCSWATTEAQIVEFVADVQSIAPGV